MNRPPSHSFWRIAVTLVVCQASLSGCVSNSEYQRIIVERDTLKTQLQRLQEDLAKTRGDLARRQQDLDALQDEDATVALVARLRESIDTLQMREQSLKDELSSKEETIQWQRSRNDSLAEQLRGTNIEAETLRSDAQACQQALAQIIEAAETPAVIESQIDGEFEGWEGETVFVLTNGQIWQQSSYDYYKLPFRLLALKVFY